MNREQRARAPGKLLLFGEHSAVYGYPAVGVALDRYLTVLHTPGARWSVTLYNGGDTPAREPFPQADRFFAHLTRTIIRCDPAGESNSAHSTKRPVPGHLQVWSDLPIAGGFGSSAALCAALARIFHPGEYNPIADWAIAHELEHFFHGTPSGIDTGLSTLGGAQAFSFFRPGELPEARECRLPSMHLVVGSIPRATDTKSLVTGVRRRMEDSPDTTMRYMEQLGELSRSVTAVADQSPVDVATFASTANAAQEILRELELSTPTLDNLLSGGREAGALGGKLSGAGGGGAFYLVCETEAAVDRVAEAIREALKREQITATALFSMAV